MPQLRKGQVSMDTIEHKSTKSYSKTLCQKIVGLQNCSLRPSFVLLASPIEEGEDYGTAIWKIRIHNN